MGDIGFSEILIIALVILVLFGSKKIPDFMRGLGKGVREFNDAKDSVRKELENGMKEKENAPKSPTTTNTEAKNTETTSTNDVSEK